MAGEVPATPSSWMISRHHCHSSGFRPESGADFLPRFSLVCPSHKRYSLLHQREKTVDSILALTPSSLRYINDTCSELRSAQSADRDCESQRAA